jgi:hypothetical protein
MRRGPHAARSAIELKMNLTDQKETFVSRFPVWSS